MRNEPLVAPVKVLCLSTSSCSCFFLRKVYMMFSNEADLHVLFSFLPFSSISFHGGFLGGDGLGGRGEQCIGSGGWITG